MPRTASKQALVSYGGEDDDEFHQRQSLDNDEDSSQPKRSKLDNEIAVVLDEGRPSREQSHPTSDRSHKSIKSEATTDEIDVDELLEKPLEGMLFHFNFLFFT